jgi:hypothetical protein
MSVELTKIVGGGSADAIRTKAESQIGQDVGADNFLKFGFGDPVIYLTDDMTVIRRNQYL